MWMFVKSPDRKLFLCPGSRLTFILLEWPFRILFKGFSLMMSHLDNGELLGSRILA